MFDTRVQIGGDGMTQLLLLPGHRGHGNIYLLSSPWEIFTLDSISVELSFRSNSDPLRTIDVHETMCIGDWFSTLAHGRRASVRVQRLERKQSK